jgi:hypothetical protein
MLTKQVVFHSRASNGERVIQPLTGEGLEKTASAEFRSHLHPKIQEFVHAVRPTRHGIYVLVNALGAGEFWGSNVNGDFFPEAALVHAPPGWDQLSQAEQKAVAKTWSHGYPTFLNAHAYTHHVNKDPSRAFGTVELATWNPIMHRVELVLFLDRARAEMFGASSVMARIDAGEYPDVSMGCRVPYDVCMICEHRSKTDKDYCIHCISEKNDRELGLYGGHGGAYYGFGLNRILPDGRKVAVRNERPRFFDLSCVFIGADKTAKVMAKGEERDGRFCLGSFCSLPRPSAEIGEQFSKEAALIRSDLQKPTTDLLSAVFMLRKPAGPKPGPEVMGDKSQPERNHESVKLAGGKVKRQTTFDGLTLKIEFDAGDTRTGTNKETGEKWERKMFAAYGYIPKTKGDDGEAVDIYLRPNPEAGADVFVVHQVKKDGSPDEDKVMLGYPDKEAAISSFKNHVPKWCFGSVTRLTRQEFDEYLSDREKTASASSCGLSVCSCGCTQEDAEEQLSSLFLPQEKRAFHNKISELLKDVPAGPFREETLPKLEVQEKSIPTDMLDHMAQKGLGPALATACMMGIVLKPQEFQRLVLIRMGEKPLADTMDEHNVVFPPSKETDHSVGVNPAAADDELKQLLMPLLAARSIAAPLMKERAFQASRAPKKGQAPEACPVPSPLMDKLAAAYNGYRSSLVKKASSIADHLALDPQLRSRAFEPGMATAFARGFEKSAQARVLSPESLAYLVGAHYADRDFLNESLAQSGYVAEAAA